MREMGWTYEQLMDRPQWEISLIYADMTLDHEERERK